MTEVHGDIVEPEISLAELGGGNPDRHIAFQAWIMRLVHLTHSAHANSRKDLVRAEFIAWRQRHLFVRAWFSRSGSRYILDDGPLVHYYSQIPVWRGVEEPVKSSKRMADRPGALRQNPQPLLASVISEE